jgi:hypothetical protein
MTPEEALQDVTDAVTFLRFAQALELERRVDKEREASVVSSPYSATSLGWENVSIEDFLESAVAWAKDTGWASRDLSEPASMWRAFADFLHAGKVYE